MAIGSALGGALVTVAGAGVSFAANAASFLVDVVVLATMRAGASPRVRRTPRQIREGGPLAAALNAVVGWRAPFIVGACSAFIAASWLEQRVITSRQLGSLRGSCKYREVPSTTAKCS
jgi:hypothetical protein